MVGEDKGVRIGFAKGPGVKTPGAGGWRQQAPHFVLLLLIGCQPPPPPWLGACLLPVAQAQPGAHPGKCVALLAATQCLE